MTGTEHETEAVREYRRVLDDIAANQVVTAAEDIITAVWIEELERARGDVLESAGPIRRADQAAREKVRQAQEGGDPRVIARAQEHLSKVVEEHRPDLQRICLVLEALDAELERTCRTVAARTRQRRRDLSRLRAAWDDAYGE